MSLTPTATPTAAPAPVRPSHLKPTDRLSRTRERIAASLRRAIVAPATCASIADVCVVSPNVIERMTRGEAPVCLDKIEVGSPASAARFYRDRLADLDAEQPRPHLSLLDHVARIGVEFGDVPRAVIEAGAEVDEGERRRVEREILDLRAACDRALADLRAR